MPTACAGTARVAAVLAGPPQDAPVVAAGPHALYARVGGTTGSDVVAVLTAGAVDVPVGVRTTWDRLPSHPPTVRVGGGALRLGRHELRVSRLVERRVPRLPGLAHARPAVPDSLVRVAVEHVPAAALARLRDRDAAAADLLLGLGPGLTPVGDDVLAGWLLARTAAGGDADADPVASRVRDTATTRTSCVSAALLARALDGEAVPPLTDALRAQAAAADPLPALRRLHAVGASSGAGLLLGVLTALPTTHRERP